MGEVPRRSVERPPAADGLADLVAELAPALPAYLAAQRWFGSKGRTVRSVAVADGAELPAEVPAALLLLDIAFVEGPPEVYLLPVAARPRAAARQVLAPDVAPLAELAAPDGDWLLYDAVDDPAVCAALLRHVEDARRLPARAGIFGFERTPGLSRATGGERPMTSDSIRRIRGEQSNSSVVFDERLILKLFRRLAAGENPELEISRFLSFKTRFRHAPLLAGFVHYQGPEADRTVAVLQTFVPSEADGWTWTLAALREFYAAAGRRSGVPAPDQLADAAIGLCGPYLSGVRRLGEVTGELHAALAAEPGDPAFAPERVTTADLAAWRTAVEGQLAQGLAGLRTAADPLTRAHRATIERILAASAAVQARVTEAIARLADAPLWKTRIHGDYHLGQVLRRAGPGDEFVVLDFEGEPARPLAARRAKQSPLRDVAGMLRSFTYASYAGLFEAAGPAAAAVRHLEAWRSAWEAAAAGAFLDGYRAATVTRGVAVVPAAPEVLARLLSVFCLEKAAYELQYELNNRPTWLPIPLAAFTRELVGLKT
jgi:maltose alpha-D-glucosyltransferase/alpha-amylase